jgi:hypothetical protein
MPERRVKGKSVPITQDEIDLMVSRFNEGKSWRTIGRQVERHWQTVEKYVRRELTQREGEELRREAMRQAVLLHHQDFPPVLEKLRGRYHLPSLRPTEQHRGVRVWESLPPLERRDRLLLQEFRTGHAKASPLWGWLDAWEQKTRAFHEAEGHLEVWMKDRLEQEMGRLAGVQVSELAVPLLLEDAMLRGTGEGAVSGKMSVSESESGSQVCWGEYPLATGGGDLQAAAALLGRLREETEGHPEAERLGALHREMKALREKIEEELELLALRRAYPGRCRLCPL